MIESKALGERVTPHNLRLRRCEVTAQKVLSFSGLASSILKIFCRHAVNAIHVETLESLHLAAMSLDELKAAYQSGRITAKAVRGHLGRRPKKLITTWGKSGRKAAVDYRLVVDWKHGQQPDFG